MAESSGDLSLGYMMGQSESKGGNCGMFNGDGFWGIILLALLFGGRGWGGSGNGMGGSDGISAGFAWQGIDNGIRGIQQGICDSTYALNNSIMSGFHGVDTGLCNISHQISDCCCRTQQAISDSTRDIVENQNRNTRSILDFLVQDKIESLRDENQALKFQASQVAQNAFITANQDAQTAELIRRLGRDNPVPAYWVNPPTPVSVPNSNCGCSCGCGCGF